MNHAHFCQRRTLAQDRMCRVDQCSCGNIHLHIGPISMCLDRRALDALAEVIGAARAALGGCEAPAIEPTLGARLAGKDRAN